MDPRIDNIYCNGALWLWWWCDVLMLLNLFMVICLDLIMVACGKCGTFISEIYSKIYHRWLSVCSNISVLLSCYIIDLHFCLLFPSRYDPSTGIYGMDFFVVLERPGYRVGRRRRCKARVGIQHRVTKEDAMKWFQVKYEGVILNKSQNIGV